MKDLILLKDYIQGVSISKQAVYKQIRSNKLTIALIDNHKYVVLEAKKEIVNPEIEQQLKQKISNLKSNLSNQKEAHKEEISNLLSVQANTMLIVALVCIVSTAIIVKVFL